MGTSKFKERGTDDKEEVIRLAKEGKTKAEISRETGISETSITKWCKKAGVSLAKRIR